jgi:RyR domain
MEETILHFEQIAKVAHEVNRAYCQSLGDDSQPSWEGAPEWQKSSAINGVQYHVENPGADPRSSHENWLKQKREEGWVHGPVKNAELKQHPCMVPFDNLPTSQKAKDFIFRQVVHSLWALVQQTA